MAFYNQGRYSSPADYWNEQQKNQRGNIQNVLNTIMMLKQYKMNQADKQKEQQRYVAEQAQKERTFGLQQKQYQSLDEYRKAQIAEWKEPPPPQKRPDSIVVTEYLSKKLNIGTGDAYNLFKGTKTLQRIQDEATARARGDLLGKPPTKKEPSMMDDKVAYWLRKIKVGTVSAEDGIRNIDSIMGGKPPVDPPGMKGASSRDANHRGLVGSWFLKKTGKPKYGEKEIKEIIAISEGNPPRNTEGLRVDMPFDYNLAVMNQTDGIDTDADRKIIENFDDAFAAFQMAREAGILRFSGDRPSTLKPKDDKYFMKWAKMYRFSEDKEFPYSQVHKWFQYYK